MLRLDGLSKAYGSVRAINNLSFDVDEGRFFVLFGPSSVGKTDDAAHDRRARPSRTGTLSRSAAGHDPRADRGPRRVDGVPVFRAYPHLTVYDNLAYPLREEKTRRAEIDKRVKETAEMLKLSHRLDRKPNTLSGGEQQRVALGRSLIRRPRFCCSTSR